MRKFLIHIDISFDKDIKTVWVSISVAVTFVYRKDNVHCLSK